MKKFLLLLVLVVIAGSAFIYSDPQLRRDALAMWDDFLGKTGIDKKSAIFYKWVDSSGVIQYTQEPPPAGTSYEIVEARTDVNILPLPDKLKK